jgi:hypothetical protein
MILSGNPAGLNNRIFLIDATGLITPTLRLPMLSFKPVTISTPFSTEALMTKSLANDSTKITTTVIKSIFHGFFILHLLNDRLTAKHSEKINPYSYP